jgi:C4-dicarboxylate-specific signal transduction histidine kinase
MGGYRLHAEDFFRRYLYAGDAPAFASYIERAVKGANQSQPSQTDMRTAGIDGEPRVMFVRCKAEITAASEAARLIGTIQDITEPRRAQEALRAAREELGRASRLTAVGQMAASIAHEINQPLGAIVANANAGLRFLKAQTPDLGEACDALTQIVGEGHRASQVIGSVRAMFKKESQQRARLDVNRIIREVLALSRGELQSQHIQVQTDLCEELPKVSGVAVQLQQVMFNLVTNAIEAMASTSGRANVLRVSSARREPRGVVITVEDSGSGISEKDMDHIFDLFFTTKSHGMGLGLSICRNIIEAHEGRLSVSPAAGGGSVFQIALPAAKVLS